MTASHTSVGPRTPNVWAAGAAAVAIGCIVVIDALPALVPATDRVVSNLDDLAHLATAVLVVLLLRPSPVFAAALIVAGVAIDLDHVPDRLGWDVPNADAARPYHTLAVVALLLALSAIAPRARAFTAGAAAGVAVHLWRDLATGPGVPLIWPVSERIIRLPYSVYAGSIAAAVVVLVVVRGRRRSESASP
jgi:inner membrane protein